MAGLVALAGTAQRADAALVDKIATRRNGADNTRDYVDGCVPGGRSDNVTASSQSR